MIGVKDAVTSAMAFAKELLGDRGSQFQLEEVEESKSRGSEVWLITLSMPQINSLAGILSQRREYKTFAVDGQTGKVLSMKIRELAGPE